MEHMYECRIAQISFNYITCIIYQLKYIIHQLICIIHQLVCIIYQLTCIIYENLYYLPTRMYYLPTTCIVHQLHVLSTNSRVLSTNSDFIIHQLRSLKFHNAGSAGLAWCSNWSLSRRIGLLKIHEFTVRRIELICAGYAYTSALQCHTMEHVFA